MVNIDLNTTSSFVNDMDDTNAIFSEVLLHLHNLDAKLVTIKDELFLPSLHNKTEYTISSNIHQKQINSVLELVISSKANLDAAIETLKSKQKFLVSLDFNNSNNNKGLKQKHKINSHLNLNELLSSEEDSVQVKKNDYLKTHNSLLSITDKEFEKSMLWIKYKLDNTNAHLDLNKLNLRELYNELARIDLLKKHLVIDTTLKDLDKIILMNDKLSLYESLKAKFDSLFWKVVNIVFKEFSNHFDKETTKANSFANIINDIINIINKETEIYYAYYEKKIEYFQSSKSCGNYKQKLENVLRQIVLDKVRTNQGVDIEYDLLINNFSQLITEAFDKSTMFYDMFPRNYNLSNIIISEYHRLIYDELTQRINKEKQANSMVGDRIIKSIKFIVEYKLAFNKLKKHYLLQLSSNKYAFLQKELELEYICLVGNKLKEWLSNIMSDFKIKFMKRNIPPQADARGKIYLDHAHLLSQMFYEQIDLVKEAQSESLICKIVNECYSTAIMYNEKLKCIIEDEMKVYHESKEALLGLPEYLIAISNDGLVMLKNIDESNMNTDQFINTKELQSSLQNRKKAYIRINDDTTEYVLTCICDIIYKDVYQPLFKRLYTKQWYIVEIIDGVIATIKDYIDDYQKLMHKDIFERFMVILMEEFVAKLINRLKGKASLFVLDKFEERANRDLTKIKAFFYQFFVQFFVDENFKPYVNLIRYICSNQNILQPAFMDLKKEYPDLSTNLIKNLLGKRSDMNYLKLQETMNKIKKLELGPNQNNNASDFNEGEEISQSSTVFSKVKPSKFELAIKKLHKFSI